jgi:GntR family transcriptional repressor for pyruvate dehydrogenase complex
MAQNIDTLGNFKEVLIEKPSDLIIKQLRHLITSGQLKPGDKLPSERQLSEKMGIGRTYVRDAIKKLEYYGVLKTLPQSGTVVSKLEIASLDGLITDILRMNGTDFFSLVETRVLLETNAAVLAAQRRTDKDLEHIEQSLEAFRIKGEATGQAVEEDLMFHIAISEASQNSVLKSLMMILMPDVVSNYAKYKACGPERYKKSLEEHIVIYNHIKKREPEKARETMEKHLKDILAFSKKNSFIIQ